MRAGPSVTGRKTVQVEVRRKRAPAAPSRTGQPAVETVATPQVTPESPAGSEAPVAAPATTPEADDKLTEQERAARVRALQEGLARADAPAGGTNVLADDHAEALIGTSVETPVEAAAPLIVV